MAYNTFIPIVTDGLVFHIDAYNRKSYVSGSTVVNDLTINSNNGTLINGVGFDNNAWTFDGVNDYIRVPTIDMSTYSEFTICGWVYPTSDSSDKSLIGNWETLGQTQFYIYLDVDDGAVGWDFIITDDTLSLSRIGTTDPNANLNEWQYLVATFNTTEIQLYVDTVFRGSTPTGNPIYPTPPNNGFVIGNDFILSPNRSYEGNISNVKIYNRVLSASEIQQNYDATKWRFR